jgi:hypothetical protein
LSAPRGCRQVVTSTRLTVGDGEPRGARVGSRLVAVLGRPAARTHSTSPQPNEEKRGTGCTSYGVTQSTSSSDVRTELDKILTASTPCAPLPLAAKLASRADAPLDKPASLGLIARVEIGVCQILGVNAFCL